MIKAIFVTQDSTLKLTPITVKFLWNPFLCPEFAVLLSFWQMSLFYSTAGQMCAHGVFAKYTSGKRALANVCCIWYESTYIWFLVNVYCMKRLGESWQTGFLKSTQSWAHLTMKIIFVQYQQHHLDSYSITEIIWLGNRLILYIPMSSMKFLWMHFLWKECIELVSQKCICQVCSDRSIWSAPLLFLPGSGNS